MMTPGDAERIAALVLASFDEYIAPEYTRQGVAEFRHYVEPQALRQRVERDHFVLVAEVDGDLAGMIEMRDCNHVALLFVAKDFHRRGIAARLLERGLAEARARRPGVERVTINSSRYGVPAYERMGFRQTGPERTVNGIVFIPLAMRLDRAGNPAGQPEHEAPRPTKAPTPGVAGTAPSD